MSHTGIEAQFTVSLGSFKLQMDELLAGHGVTALFGPSGCGKTTALRAIAGLTRPTQARIAVNGTVWQDDAQGLWLPTHQRPLGYVFQEANLFAHLSVRQNVEYGLKRCTARGATPSPAALEQAIDLLGIGPLMQRPVTHLSGGEAQRVAIARALASSPRVLLMDEPLAALDQERKAELLPYLDQLSHHLQLPMVYVSHSIDEVSRLAQRLVLMRDGRVLAHGPVDALMARLDLPLAHGDQTASLISGTLSGHDASDHLWTMQCGNQQLHWTEPRAHYALGDAVRLRIMARDVSLSLQPLADSSILNSLPVHITALQADSPGQVLAQLRCGEQVLLARVSARSARLLALSVGMPVYAHIKSVAVLR